MYINDIFTSIDGEINQWHQGVLSTFIRFSNCNFLCKCAYCDTEFEQFKEMSLKELVAKVKKENTKKVTITGGEPLIQKNLKHFIFKLTEHDYLISVETNGSLKIPIELLYLRNCNWVMDIKLPSSCNSHYMLPIEYYAELPENVFFKFCISDYVDYELACEYVRQVNQKKKHLVAFSPIINEDKLWPKKLADKIIEDKFNCVFNLQIHKFLNVK